MTDQYRPKERYQMAIPFYTSPQGTGGTGFITDEFGTRTIFLAPPPTVTQEKFNTLESTYRTVCEGLGNLAKDNSAQTKTITKINKIAASFYKENQELKEHADNLTKRIQALTKELWHYKFPETDEYRWGPDTQPEYPSDS